MLKARRLPCNFIGLRLGLWLGVSLTLPDCVSVHFQISPANCCSYSRSPASSGIGFVAEFLFKTAVCYPRKKPMTLVVENFCNSILHLYILLFFIFSFQHELGTSRHRSIAAMLIIRLPTVRLGLPFVFAKDLYLDGLFQQIQFLNLLVAR